MAQSPAATLIDDVWQASRLSSLSESMVSNLLAGIEQHPEMESLTPQRRKRLLAHYRRHASAERFRRGLRQELEQSSTQQLNALMDLTRSRVAQRALEHELAYVAVKPKVMLNYASQMRSTAQGQKRLDAIDRLDRALGVTDMAVTVAATTLYGTAVAMRQLNDATPTATPPNLERLVSQFIEQAKPWQAQQIRVIYLYLYRHLSLDDLNAYVALQENEHVSKLQRRFVQSLGQVMISIQRDVMRDVLDDLKDGGQQAV